MNDSFRKKKRAYYHGNYEHDEDLECFIRKVPETFVVGKNMSGKKGKHQPYYHGRKKRNILDNFVGRVVYTYFGVGFQHGKQDGVYLEIDENYDGRQS